MKKKTNKFIAILVATMILLTLCACSQGSSSETTEKADDSISVVDMTGRTITLDEPAERIVALSASDCEILNAIGAGD